MSKNMIGYAEAAKILAALAGKEEGSFGDLLRIANQFAPEDMSSDGGKKERPLTPVERELQRLTWYTKKSKKLPKIPQDEKARIDYFIAAQNNEIEPSISQLVQQTLVDFLETPSTGLVSIGSSWGRYLRPLLSYSFNKLIEEGGKYVKVDYLTEHPNGLAVASVLKPNISPVEIGYHKTANVVTTGTYYLKWGSEKLVVSFEFDGPCCSLSATISEKNRDVGEVFLRDFNEACSKNNIYKNQKLAMVEGSLSFINLEPIKMKDVFLPKKIKGEVEENTLGVLKHKNSLLKTPAGINRSIILAGMPGTGKTQLFKAIANTVEDCTVILVSSKAFQYTSDVSILYAAARDLGPTLLILEDMDLIGTDRKSGSRKDNELLGEFLTQMSGAESNEKIITVASTNDLSTIDTALANRPGRFDRVIPVPLPNRKYRSKMLKAFLAGMGVKTKISTDAWEEVIAQTRGFSGAYLKEIARTCLIKSVVRKEASTENVVVYDDDILSATMLVKENFAASRKAKKNR